MKRKRLAAAISSVTVPTAGVLPAAALAQPDELTEVVVTATRRTNAVQDIPINITAISGQTIEDRRLVGLDEIARFAPGLTMLDRGPRDEFPDLLVRGLNTSGLGPFFTAGTVATYLGEIPLEADFRTHDLERVEVLIGPQGTLYGSGTLGGAVRYIPVRPQGRGVEGEVSSKLFTLGESDGLGTEAGFVLDAPLGSESLAFRASINYLDDPGYIDYPYVVREGGVSDPQPDLSDPEAVAANLRRVEDANFEDSLSGRLALRWRPIEALDATLTYHYQDVDTGGRSLANVESFGTGPYEAAYRYEEPNSVERELLSLEVTADLGFAELTSATGATEYRQRGQRDQTDLLLNFQYYYETFPSFSAYTREVEDQDSFVQELRLVSKSAGPLGWIGGIFYSEIEASGTSSEFTPGFDQWAVDNLGGVALRPDALEYYAVSDETLEESAVFGEVSYDFAATWQITLGARVYEFDDELSSGFALPLLDTVYFGDPPDSINLDVNDNRTEDSGTLYKLNLSHRLANDALGYLTVSEGYRIGGVNSVPECAPDDLENGGQALCALPEEVLIEADTTTNYEIGVHSTLLDGRLTLNGALYHIDWKDLQVDDVTLNGNLPITSNGGEADSDGLELATRWVISDRWEFQGTYSYNRAELAEGTDAILGGRETGPLFTPAGSRLPGSPEHAASAGLTYSTTLGAGLGLDVNYGVVYVGDILNSIGAGEEPSVLPWRGEKIPSYRLHSVSAKLTGERWTASLYVDNLLDEYYYTSTRSSRRLLEEYRNFTDVPSNTPGFVLRSYARYVGRPRTFGIGMSYDF